jgi:acetyltransferase-like isoleucine patch superfamily enzyme
MNFFNEDFIADSMENFISDFMRRFDFARQTESDFTDPNLLYDYNEVQELFLDETVNNYVYLAGRSGLHKTAMLKQMAVNLMANGVESRNILYYDFTIPFVRSFFPKILFDFIARRNRQQNFYLIINEITLHIQWKQRIEEIREKYDFVKTLASCSIAPEIHEHFFDNPNGYSKIVVLSSKNESNTKSEQIAFGVFNEFKYNIKNEICEIKGLTKEGKIMETHSIPQAINGYPVKVIASGAFHHRSEMKEIVIPESVEYIGDYAFTHCGNLKQIALPHNLKYIGDCAFLGAVQLETLTGGGNITHIGNSALYATQWLKNNTNNFISLGKTLYKYNGTETVLSIPNEIKVIGYYAFAENSFIETVDLKGVETINEGAFYNCGNLRYIAHYQSDKTSAFQFFNCGSLQNFNYELRQVGRFAFFGNYTLETIRVSNAVIQNNAFEKTNLKTVIGHIATIGDFAFYQTKLNAADLSKTKRVGRFSFFNAGLESVSLENAARIGDYAFVKNKKLKEVTISETAVIGEGVFSLSNNIEKAVLSGKYPLDYYFKEKSKIKYLTVKGMCIDNINRNNPYLRSLTVNSEKIGNWAFYHNDNLCHIELHNKHFGAWCFAYCDKIETIDIPSAVAFIGMNCFRYCRNLKTIILRNDRIVSFGANAFYSTADNKKIYVKNRPAYLKTNLWKEYRDYFQDIDN